jgi:DNA-directed RNA polymerase subunit M/transcription elongation factor TFIIS
MKTKWIMKTSYITLSDDAGQLMHCPACGYSYTSHERVDVYQRDSEDSATGIHVSVHETDVDIDRVMGFNPSDRRNGIRIYFSCEGCGEDHPGFSITMVQHKGRTFFEAQYYVEDQS